jgi:hypothetical protein
MRASSVCAFLYKGQHLHSLSANAVRGKWLSTGTHPLGGQIAEYARVPVSALCKAFSVQIARVWAGAEDDAGELGAVGGFDLARLLAVAWPGVPVSWLAAERG